MSTGARETRTAHIFSPPLGAFLFSFAAYGAAAEPEVGVRSAGEPGEEPLEVPDTHGQTSPEVAGEKKP